MRLFVPSRGISHARAHTHIPGLHGRPFTCSPPHVTPRARTHTHTHQAQTRCKQPTSSCEISNARFGVSRGGPGSSTTQLSTARRAHPTTPTTTTTMARASRPSGGGGGFAGVGGGGHTNAQGPRHPTPRQAPRTRTRARSATRRSALKSSVGAHALGTCLPACARARLPGALGAGARPRDDQGDDEWNHQAITAPSRRPKPCP